MAKCNRLTPLPFKGLNAHSVMSVLVRSLRAVLMVRGWQFLSLHGCTSTTEAASRHQFAFENDVCAYMAGK